MLIVDDPLLALILRFVVDTDETAADSDEFLKLQLQTLKQYLARFPEREQGQRAMEWIEQHAKRYREDWQKRAVSRRTVYLRCADCPLAGRGVSEYCEIHEQWLYLLRRYTAGQIPSQAYIEESLAVLQGHKDQLKRRCAPPPPLLMPVEPPQTEKEETKKKKKKGKGRKKAKRKSPSRIEPSALSPKRAQRR